MTAIRVARRRRYTTLDRAMLNDGSLSFRARGVLAWLLDKPDDWTTNADAIAQAGTEGREAVRSALRELETAEYLERRKWRDEGGRWASEWLVYERPKGTEPGRETGAGYPLRVSGPQLLKTETEDGPSQALRERAQPKCFACHGSGVAYHPGAGRDGPCDCTRPYAPSESNPSPATAEGLSR